jgi:DNA invertase Pin-like site-specific DNA recombinase
MKARGGANGMRKYPGLLSGERNGRSKITDDERNEIRRLRRSGWKAKGLAALYGLSVSQIVRITKNAAGKP